MQFAEIKRYINICIKRNIPFAAFAFPGEETYSFYAQMPETLPDAEEWFDQKSHKFAATKFAEGFDDDAAYLVEQLSVEDIEKLDHDNVTFDAPSCRPVFDTTSAPLYFAQASQFISALKRSKGKTVLSRVIAGETQRTDITGIAEEYFALYPASFRNIYMHPATGLWMGATPEIIASWSENTGTFATMALAGTRTVSDDDLPWDSKNLNEQRMVAEFIQRGLVRMGLQPDSDQAPCTLRYGSIEHLCTRFSAPCASPQQALDAMLALDPTPAVAGHPRQSSLQRINRMEVHFRQCYAGMLVAESPGRSLDAFVNLRCVHLYPLPNSTQYNIFVGGGLTSESVPATEWWETNAKASALMRLLGTPEIPTDGIF